LAGLALTHFDLWEDKYSNALLIAVTEKRTKAEMDQYVDVFSRVLAG